MVVTVLKTTFPKAPPRVIHYRDYKHFKIHAFRGELKNQLSDISNYTEFEDTLLKILEKRLNPFEASSLE